MVISELQAVGCTLTVGALLFMSAAVMSGPAGAIDNDLFIGQFLVEDARSAPQYQQPLHYHIVHDVLINGVKGWASGDVLGYPETQPDNNIHREIGQRTGSNCMPHSRTCRP